jgi:hypothetical protein
MPRRARIEYEGAFYHLLRWVDRREAIFLDDEDRQGFLSTLGEVCERTGFVVHHYVLMNNYNPARAHLVNADTGGKSCRWHEVVSNASCTYARTDPLLPRGLTLSFLALSSKAARRCALRP